MKRSAAPMPSARRSGFRFLDHTADLAMECFGKDLAELLVNGAKGMFEAMVEEALPGIPAERRIEIAADSPDTLFLSWLRELLFIYDTERFLPTDFQLSIGCSNASCRGRFSRRSRGYYGEVGPPGRPCISEDPAQSDGRADEVPTSLESGSRPAFGGVGTVRPYSERSSPKEAANAYEASALLTGQTISHEVILPGPIKAVTYHGLKAEKATSGGWRAYVVFDT